VAAPVSRTAAGPGTGRWRGMAGFDIVRRDDPRWFATQPPKHERPQCRSCRFNGYPVRLRLWRDASVFTFRCPCCGFQTDPVP
jgi:hypothetical protein